MDALTAGMNTLVQETHMLTGLSVTFGTDKEAETRLTGNACEVKYEGDACFPDVRPLTPDSIYDLASLTKCFTAILAMQLIEEGKLQKDASVASYAPWFTHLDTLSVFDLLTFQTGLESPGRIDEAPTPEEGMRRLYETKACPPPTIRLYSDMHALIAARVLEAVLDAPYMDILESRILSPLGMSETGPTADPARVLSYAYEHRLISGAHSMRQGPMPGIIHDPKAQLLQPSCLTCCGHAGLFSTQRDMLRFAQGLLSGELLPLSTLSAMGENRTGYQYPDGTYRQFLGVLCFSKHPQQRLSELPEWMGKHTIGLSGFTGNHLAIDPDSKTFILYLGNRVHNRLTRVTPSSAEAYSALGLNPDGTGQLELPDLPAPIFSSASYVYFKDRCLGNPIGEIMRSYGWLRQ